ncbi:hypothetical protein LXL04_020160 [Taraxacum kok-saghyz]
MDTNIVRSLMELKGNENDCGTVYDRKRKREPNVSEVGEGSKNKEVKKAAKNNSKKKSQPLQKRRYSSRLASVISKKTVQNRPVSRSQAKGVVIEVEEDEEDEEEEEEEVRERRSKNKHDRGSKENVRNKSSSSKKGKDKKEEPKGKILEEEEEEEVRERRSKNKHDGGSKENVKNKSSSSKKGKDKKKEPKGKITFVGKRLVVDMEKRSRKRLVDEDDEDVAVDEAGPSRKGKRQEAKKPKKEAVRKQKAANDFPSMKNRCSPIALLSIIHGLSKEQKNSIREMGFGTLLQSKLMDVPMKMCYYVLEKLDVEGMKVVVETGVLDVSAQSVNDMLGLPFGGMSFEEMDVVDEDDEESCMFEWKNQFENIKDLRLKQLKNVICLTREADFNFRINFLVLFINTFCESTSMGKCNLNALYHIKKETDISSIDWCQYVVDYLKRTKKAYKPDKESSFFYGPAAYLAVLKFDRMDIPRTRPAICYWSSEMIRVREDYEMMEEGFGLGKVNGVFVEDFVDISDDDEDDIEYEEQVQDDVEIDSDDERSEEGFYTHIKNMFETMEVNLVRLHDLIDKAIEKYPDNRSFQIYKSMVSIPEEFEFPNVADNDEDVAIATPAFGQDAEEESDDNDDEDEDDVNNNDGNDDDGNDDDGNDDHDHGDAGIDVVVNDEKDENEDEAVGGDGGTEELTDINNIIDNVVESVVGSQYPIQVTQVESLNVQSPAETEKLEDVSEATEGEVEKKNEEEVKEKQSVIEEKQVENVVEGNLSIVVAESSSIGGEEKMNVIPTISSSGSQEFWSSSAVENLVLAATTEKSKVIERNEQIEEKEGTKDSDESFGAPSFSLGLSQDTTISIPIQLSAVPEDVIDANPVSFLPFHGTEAVVVPFTDVPVDAVPVSVVPSSERIVDPRSALTQDENAICEWLFSRRGKPMVEIYNYNGHAVSFGGIFESLFSRTYIHSGVLDAWCDYLNENEKERDVMNSPFRLFMKPDICLSLENKVVSEDKKYEIFKENFKAGVYCDKDLLLLKGVDLVFFPVIRSEHIYLFVFNSRKPAYEGLDNSANDAEFLDKYGAVFVPLKMFFLRYLFEIGHQKAFDMSQEELTPRRIKLAWRTTLNKFDCGVFTMRHMETYFGESASSKWKPGFTNEGKFQNKLLENLRQKYAAMLLLWRMNTKRDEILGHARQYCQTVDPLVREGDRGKVAFEITGRLMLFG